MTEEMPQQQEASPPGDAAAEQTPSPGDEVARLQAELAEAREKAEEYLRLLQRVQADFTNYRRRIDQERSEVAAALKGHVLGQFLGILDDFERALGAVPAEMQDLGWVQGIALIERKMRGLLESEGVQMIPAQGRAFDPWEMEAVLEEERADVEPGRVVHVIRNGYRLNGRVLRPAQVVVSKAPSAGESQGAG